MRTIIIDTLYCIETQAPIKSEGFTTGFDFDFDGLLIAIDRQRKIDAILYDIPYEAIDTTLFLYQLYCDGYFDEHNTRRMRATARKNYSK
ncbi:MAG: hypothetical protein BGO69_15790 [Bacteroidetes bacterium 46-16]|nr:MAG: hypothetical protein BGO69_15790 [Bacteroidetes bacterium 46-16]